MRKLALVMAMAVALTSVNVGNFNPMNCVQTVSAEEDYNAIVFGNELEGKKLTQNDVKYQFKDGVLTVSGTGVVDNSYRDNVDVNSIKKIVIQPGITAIGYEAFMNLKSVKEIVIPNTVKELGLACLYGLEMDQIVIPESVNKIWPRAICSDIKKITMPGNFEFIDYGIEDGDLFEESDIFKEGNKANIYLNTDLNMNNKLAFVYAKKVHTAKNDKKYKNYGSCIYTKDGKKLVFVLDSVDHLKIRKGCKTVLTSSYSYEYDYGNEFCHLRSITIPEKVKFENDSKYCFIEASKDNSDPDCCKIIMKGKKIPGCTLSYLVNTCRGDFLLSKKYGVKSKNGMNISYDKVLVKYTGKKKKVTIPKTVKHIGANAFNNNKVTSVKFQGKVKKIDDYAFCGAEKLKSVKIPKTVTTIGKRAFSETKIAKVQLPKKLKKIGNEAFKSTKLKTVKLPKGLTKIGKGAFKKTPLEKINLPEKLVKIEDYTFNGTNLKNITFPKKITEIGNCAFAETQITTLTFPNDLKVIGDCAFFECRNLTSVSFNDKLEKIGISAFQNCCSLKKITLPKSLKYIEPWAFYAVGAEEPILPANVKIRADWYYYSKTPIY